MFKNKKKRREPQPKRRKKKVRGEFHDGNFKVILYKEGKKDGIVFCFWRFFWLV